MADAFDQVPAPAVKMNAEAKKLWIKALTSGKYVKICSDMRSECVLTDENGHKVRNEWGDPEYGVDMSKNEMCVMGVLADVALKASGLKYTSDNYMLFSDGSNPTPKTMKWAGLDWQVAGGLIETNDNRRKSFPQFAKWIKENL